MPSYRYTSPKGQVWRFESERELSDAELSALQPPEDDEPAAKGTSPFANITPAKALLAMNPLTSVPAVASMLPDSVKDAGSAALETLGGYLQIPREQTSDRLARAASRLTGYSGTEEKGPDGRTRQVTAPELLERGAMPERTRGGRATSENYRDAALDGNPFSIIVQGATQALGLPSPGVFGDLDALVERRRRAGDERTARALEVGEDLVRVPGRLIAGAATDPMIAAGAVGVGETLGARTPAALARLSRVDQALAGTGAAVGGVGAAREVEATKDALERGEYGKAAEHGLGALLQAGMSGLGARGVHEIGAARAKMAPSGGRAYVDDPLLSAAERQALLAEEAALLRRDVGQSVAEARQGLADVRELDPLSVTPLQAAADPKGSAQRAAAALEQAKREARTAAEVEGAQSEAAQIASGVPEGPLSARAELERIPRDPSGRPDPQAAAALEGLRIRLMEQLRDGTLSPDDARVLLRIPNREGRITEGPEASRNLAIDDEAAGQLRALRTEISRRIEAERATPQDAAALSEIDAFMADRIRQQAKAAGDSAAQVVRGAPREDPSGGTTLDRQLAGIEAAIDENLGRVATPRLNRPVERQAPTPEPPQQVEAEPSLVGRQVTRAGPEGPPERPGVAYVERSGDHRLSPRAAAVAGYEAPIDPISSRAALLKDLLEARALASKQARARQEEGALRRGDVAREAEAAKAAEVGDLPERQKAQRVLERAGSLKPAQQHLEAIPEGGREVAGRMRAAQFDEERIGGAFWGGVRGAMEDVLPGNSRAQGLLFEREVAPVLDGTVPLESVSPAAQAAVAGIKPKLDAMYEELAAAYREHGLEPPPREEAYLPRIRKGESLTEIEAQARELAQKEHASVEDAAYALRVAPRARMKPEAVLAELRQGEHVPGTSGVIASRADRVRRFEQERVPNQKLEDFRTDIGVLEEYGSVMARRIAELKHFGKNGEALQALIDRMPDTPREFGGLKVGDRAFAQTLVDRVRGVMPITLGQQAASIGRSVAGVQGLVFAPTQQPLSLAQIGTMSIRHPVAAAKGIQSLLFDGIKRGDLRDPIKLAKGVRNSWRRADIKAEEVGAITKRTSEELAQAFGLGDSARTDTVAGKVAAIGEKAPWIGGLKVKGHTIVPGLVQADRALRIIAKNVGDFVVPRMVEAAKKGSASEQRALAYMGIDWKGYTGTPAELAKAVKFFADETNYRPNILRLPPQASSPIGRFGFQFASFMHSHSRFMGFLARNPERLAAFAAIGIPIAHASNQLRFFLKGTPYDEKPVEDVQKGISDAMMGKIHPDWTKGTKEALVAAGHAVATLGVGAIYQSMIERTDKGEITDLIPILRSVERIYAPIAGVKESAELRAQEAAARASGDTAEADRLKEQLAKLEGDTGTKILKAAVATLPQVPLPGVAGSPNEVARELLSDQKPAVPGWFGRLRDTAEEKGVVTPSDPATAGAAGRENVRRLADLVEKRSKARGQAEAMLEDRAPKTVDVKLKESEKSALREQYRLAIIEAIAKGDHVEVMRLRQEARARKIKFGRKTVRDIERRAYRPREDEQELEETLYP